MQFCLRRGGPTKGRRRGRCRARRREAPMSASVSQIESHADRVAVQPRAAEGFVTGGARTLLRVEGLAAGVAAVAIYAHAGFSWPAFALFILAPDLSMLAYLTGPQAGAAGYNLAHTNVLAMALTLAGFFGGMPVSAAGRPPRPGRSSWSRRTAKASPSAATTTVPSARPCCCRSTRITDRPVCPGWGRTSGTAGTPPKWSRQLPSAVQTPRPSA